MKQATKTDVTTQPNTRSAAVLTGKPEAGSEASSSEVRAASTVNLQQINQDGLISGAVGDPSAFVYGSQIHFLYRDISGLIWDSFYDPISNEGNLQQIAGPGGLNAAPAAAEGPSSYIYFDQTHIIYRAANGAIWDCYYVTHQSDWLLQQINLGGVSKGPAAVGNPSSFVYGLQTHVLYRAVDGTIWDSWYPGTGSQWSLQQINLSGATSAPAAAGDPSPLVYVDQTHIIYRDTGGTIWDSYYITDQLSWGLQQINLGGLTGGPAAAGDPSPFVYGIQIHVVYRAVDGTIWDSWYPGTGSQWLLQQITPLGILPNGLTGDFILAASDPLAFAYSDQTLHIVYRDSYGTLWNGYYDSASGQWVGQQLNVGGAAVGEPAAFLDSQAHVVYRDAYGYIWECTF